MFLGQEHFSTGFYVLPSLPFSTSVIKPLFYLLANICEVVALSTIYKIVIPLFFLNRGIYRITRIVMIPMPAIVIPGMMEIYDGKDNNCDNLSTR